MHLTDRDFEIVNFVLNMKFATVENIHQRFFKYKKDGSISNSEWYARERVRELVLDKYLQPVKYRFENKNYYIGTKEGYDLIRYMKSSWEPAKPIDRIDVRTFDHDQRVMESRILLEEHEKVSQWQSDKQLKAEYLCMYGPVNGRDCTPDGVYKSLAGKVIAFEYEIAQKSKKRYDEKIQHYVNCIRQNYFTAIPKYDHVRIACEYEAVYRVLCDQTSLYKQYFIIERAEELKSKLLGSGVDTFQGRKVGLQ